MRPLKVVLVGASLICVVGILGFRTRATSGVSREIELQALDPSDAARGREVLAGLCSLTPSIRPGDQRDQVPVVTGFCIDPAGYVLSSLSMMTDVDGVGVSAVTGAFCSAQVVGRDPWTDTLVVMPRKDIGLEPVPLAPNSSPRLAEPVWVFGRRLEGGTFAGNAFQGIVSAPRVSMGVEFGFHCGPDWLMELTTPFFPGFQGAPVVSAEDEVVGVVLGQVPGHANVTVAKRIGEALAAAREIIDTGDDIHRPRLGCGLTGISEHGTVTYTIDSLEADGPAARAGLKVGDKILTIDGQGLGDDLFAERSVMASLRAGRTVQVEVERAGEALSLPFLLEEGQRPVLDWERPFALQRTPDAGAHRH